MGAQLTTLKGYKTSASSWWARYKEEDNKRFEEASRKPQTEATKVNIINILPYTI